MKKLFVSLLCVVMIVTFMPSMAFADAGADGNDAGDTCVAKIGDKEYSSLGDAVADAPKDDSETTIVLQKSVTGGGVEVKAGQNIVFDFNGTTYTVGAPTVGSTGTETNGFQLLKGSKVTMKNGTLLASNYHNLKIMIQNYCDLTLENMNLDASQAPQCRLVTSFNHGTVNIIGNTNITAAEGKVACDVFYWPENGYGDGVNVTVNTTGVITGNITYGTDGTSNAQSDAKNKAKLNIQGGTLKGDLSTYDLGENPAGIEVSGGSFTDLADAVKYAKGDSSIGLAGDIVVSNETLPITFDKNVTIVGNGHKITSTVTPENKLTKPVFSITNDNTLTLNNAIVDGVHTSSSIVYFNAVSNLKTEGNVAFTNNTATTVLASGGSSENTVTVNGTLNISNNTANGMNGGKLVVADGAKVIANGNASNGIAAVVAAGNNTTIDVTNNGKRGLTLYGGTELSDNAKVNATGNQKNDIEINNGDDNVVTICGSATVTAGTMAGHDGSETAKGRDKVVVVNGSGVVIEVKQPVTGEVGEENTTEALFNKKGESADTRENGVVILGKEGTVHGTVSGQIDLPAGVTVTVPKDANASGATFDAPAGTTVKNDSNQPVKVDTPNGEVTVVPGETVESKPYEPPYIPPTTPVQKPTIEAEAGATVTLSKDGTTATIVVDKDATLKDVLLNGKSLGAVTEVPNLKTGDKLVVVVETAAEKNARLKAGVENTTIKLYYNKKEIGKGWIKLRYKKSYGYKVDNYEIFRSAKKKTNFGDEAWFVTKTNQEVLRLQSGQLRNFPFRKEKDQFRRRSLVCN